MRGTDWFGFHVHIDPIDTADALTAALDDPQLRWYGLRRMRALIATGTITAASTFAAMHPRGKDGKFIERFGWVRWFDPDDMKWHSGWVSDIDPNTGSLTIRSDGDKLSGVNPKSVYAKPKPKARINLPDPTDLAKQPSQFAKTGGQGGSNPGGMYKVVESYASESPDLSKRSAIFETSRALRQPGTPTKYGSDLNADAPDVNGVVPNDVNTVVVPRLDGTQNRYDVLTRFGPDWYRVPASGTMTTDDLLRPELKVDPADAFGQPGSTRRHAVVADLGTQAFTRGQEFDVEDVAAMFQAAASPMPQVGDRYYVKKMNIPERARNEALANDFYEVLGIPVPDVAVGKDGTTISSKLVGNTVQFDPNNPAHVAAAQEGFVADAWLSNWDVIGLTYDNIQIDADGRAWRIDAGGALAYRAQGKPKGAMFGDNVGELTSLRQSSVNSQSAKVYGGITDAQLKEQAKVLQSITPAQIETLAAVHDMPELGPVLIARRKSILDQLGIVDPPPTPEPSAPPAPKTVFNPVEAVQQMGTPPTVAVANWNQGLAALSKTTFDASDWSQPGFDADHVLVRDGDLWMADGALTVGTDGTHTGMYRNVFTGEQLRIKVTDGDDQFLSGYSGNNIDTLVDTAGPTRDLAVAEIVARAAGTPINQLSVFNVNEDSDPDRMRYQRNGLYNFVALGQAIERGRLGPTGAEGQQAWPIYNGDDDTLWEITAHDGTAVKLTRRGGTPDPASWKQDLILLDATNFAQNGPWFIPANDTTANVWLSKYTPEAPAPTGVPDGANWNVGDDVTGLDGGTYKIQGIVDDKYTLTDQWGSTYYVDESFFTDAPDDAPDVPSIGSPGADDGISDIAGVPDVAPADVPPAGFNPSDPATWHLASEAEFNAAFEDQAATEQRAAQPTGVSQKVTNDVVDGLGGGEPMLSTEMALADLDKHQQMVGKSVVVLPIEAHDNPDWQATNLGTANGLGTVIAVEQKEVYSGSSYTGGTYVPGGYTTVVAMKVQKAGSTKFSWVTGGENSKFKKVVIPVETAPVASVPTFKQNGDVFINGEKVGTFWKPYTHPAVTAHPGYHQYTAMIDGDHSITGKPMHVQANKQADLKIAANAVTFPVPPKPTKPKSTKVTATEAQIKDLNLELAITGAEIKGIEQQLEDLAKATPASGNPLNDGSQPQKGDWVFSTKDGTYAQVLNPVVVGFAGKGVTSPDMIKVKLQDPATGKWKQSNRKRDTLVSVAGPGETPFVLSTKAKQSQTGDWFGPGSQVITEGDGGKVTVLDTTSDGNIKILAADGTQYWTPSKQVIGIAAGTGGSPTLNAPAVQSTAGADDLNAQLGILNAQHAKLAATIANTVVGKPKKKKEVGTPFPGPDGMTIKQPASLAEARTANGLKNTKDNYVPTPGMILRHNDGTQYAVVELGGEWSSHKNSVQVVPVGPGMSAWDAKWRSISTLTVDHEAMLTDANGDPLPIISEVEGTDWTPSGMLIRKDFTKGYYMPDPTGAKDKFGQPKQMYRTKEVSKFYVVAPDGTVYNLDGSPTTSNAIQPGMPTERVGYIDKDHPNGKKLTVSIQQHHNTSVGQIEYAVIHDPNEPAGIPLAKRHAVATPTTPTPAPTPAPAAPAAPAAPGVPPAAPSAPNIPTPTADLPVYAGKDPTGKEMPHPPTTSSSKGVPAMQPTGAPATLDVVGVPGAHSVTNAIGETITKANKNKGSKNPEWVGTYGMADHDVIEDMLVQTQVVRDAQGNDYVEVRFRVEADVARSNHTTLITSTTNETGDWKHDGRNATNLVVGDYMAVRVSSGGGATLKGALRPDGGLKDGPKTPNAQVIAPPVLIGKNAAGTFDVYRTQVMTAGGDIGFVDLEDRSGVEPESLYVSTWDPTIPRTSNGAKGLNPNAANDGWQVKSKQLQWDRADSGTGAKEQHADGVKKAGNGYSSISTGSGWTLQRDFHGAHVEYRTTDGKNSLDGQVSIRVPVDDPAAQQKIADAMELVGVTKEAQKPPDRDAVIKLATDKVWEQFNPTWTKGKRPNSPQQALEAIDNAVGPQLGRKATMDDISIRVTPDGRVQVLVSEDVSRAIVKKNGIKHYTHRFSGGGSMENTVVGAIQGENPGLMSTTERWSHGLFYQGMSSVSDHSNDAAGFLFLRMSKSSSVGNGHAVIDAVTLHRHVDYYWQPSDTFGKRQSNQLNWLNDPSAGGSNELMLQRRMEVDLWSHIVVDPGTRKTYIDKLHKQGITHAPNGMLLEDFFVTTGGTSALAKTPPKFGDEVPLSSLPAGLPAATAVAPAVPAMAGV